ncbi:UNVERIFIED_CONTAM: hypothetical protein Sradi_0454300 [Sesamum radiatum]|uniref:SHSP domain-containing protein n=1 Tax=Sesamum radiatum TaxID=300843 RepID=A0AAW2W6U3_SESRA
MKVHPLPRQTNIALRYDFASLLAQANSCRGKKLRRLPHIFAKVLELPFHSDADVSIVETSDCLRFSAATDDISGEVWADAVEIYPGVTKAAGIMLPELASATYDDGELVVTVPKGAAEVDGGTEEDDMGGIGGGRLVLVL